MGQGLYWQNAHTAQEAWKTKREFPATNQLSNCVKGEVNEGMKGRPQEPEVITLSLRTLCAPPWFLSVQNPPGDV